MHKTQQAIISQEKHKKNQGFTLLYQNQSSNKSSSQIQKFHKPCNSSAKAVDIPEFIKQIKWLSLVCTKIALVT